MALPQRLREILSRAINKLMKNSFVHDLRAEFVNLYPSALFRAFPS